MTVFPLLLPGGLLGRGWMGGGGRYKCGKTRGRRGARLWPQLCFAYLTIWVRRRLEQRCSPVVSRPREAGLQGRHPTGGTQGKSGKHGLAIPELFWRRHRPPAWFGFFLSLRFVEAADMVVREPHMGFRKRQKN